MPALREGEEQFTNHDSCQRIEGRGGFVQNQQFRIVDHRLSQSYALQHAAGKLACVSIRVILQSHSFQNFVRPFAQGSPSNSIQPAVKADQSLCTAMVQRNTLGEKAHPAADAGMTKAFSEQTAASTGWLHKAHGEMDGRALAGSVWSEETENLSCLHGETEIVKSAKATLAAKLRYSFVILSNSSAKRIAVYSKWRADKGSMVRKISRSAIGL